MILSGRIWEERMGKNAFTDSRDKAWKKFVDKIMDHGKLRFVNDTQEKGFHTAFNAGWKAGAKCEKESMISFMEAGGDFEE